MGTASSSPREVGPPHRPGRHAPLWLRLLRESVFCLFHQLSAPWFCVRAQNRPAIEDMGPVIIAANHVSFLDPPALQAALRHHVTFMMTEVYYRLPVVRWFFRLWGAIPVAEGRPAMGALREALRTLEAGAPVVIFPEGRVSRDGLLQEGMRGIGMMLTKTGAPVIPVAIMGTYEVLPRHRFLPRRHPITVRFGEPICPSDYPDHDTDMFVGVVMDAIAALGAPRP